MMEDLIKASIALALTIVVSYGVYKGVLQFAYRRGRVMVIPVEDMRRRVVRRDVHEPVWPYDSRSL